MMNIDGIMRKLLEKYRLVQYIVCGRNRYGTLKPGIQCHVELFKNDINHGDIVHPCIRYIQEGYEGHKWWMVYTPYYRADASMENPILCYAESKDNKPPMEWKVYCEVNERPSDGYNSDPVLLYENEKLYVFWRENHSPNSLSEGFERATYVAEVRDGSVQKYKTSVVGTSDKEDDPETSPAFLKDNNGKYVCYATHLRFHSKFFRNLPSIINKPVNVILNVIDLLGLYSQQKAYGLAIWYSNILTDRFKYIKTVKFKNKNALYRPWHLDVFCCKQKTYLVIQSNQCNADILLAESTDGENFSIFKKPLMTNKTCDKVGLYKPCAGVIDGTFYLYYTAQDADNRSLNKLYLTTISWNELINKLRTL